MQCLVDCSRVKPVFNNILIDVDGENLDIFINDVASGNPYFDADDGGKPGGLGSCRTLTATAQCDPNSDDKSDALS